MMNMWEENKKKLYLFSKGKCRHFIMLFCESLSLSIASYFFIPFIVSDFINHSFYFTAWYFIGIFAICFGGFGMLYSMFSFQGKMRIKEKLYILWKVFIIFIAIRIILAVLFGVIGVIFVQRFDDIDRLKSFIDLGLQLANGPVNAFLLLYFVKLMNGMQWKFIKDHMLLLAVFCCALTLINSIMQMIGASYGALIVRSFISAGTITLVIIITFYITNQEKVNES
ncbi:hypothetical protein [Candidatus Galacturonibacter soehngenii]|uniref:Uncharacterized protein n=1 Tax=Candidatus Galacturonatibacter soehngenii TaxID=2307010 RepID=A0A7V7UBX7_9FIRM|nr:hypothetical protein [Candidatus Galacturonibacter soehngenii]KAB1438079.1 hypothetical protein F7O84_11000 [Candidatus Galacturonibacter soehngenii]